VGGERWHCATLIDVFQTHQVRLDGRISARQHLFGELEQIISGFHLGQSEPLRTPRPRRTAVRPVEPQMVTHLAAQELPDRRIERLAPNVPQGGIDPRHGLPGDPSHVPHRRSGQLPPDRLNVHGVLADDPLCIALYSGRHGPWRSPVGAIPPAHQAGFAGLHLDKRPGPKSPIDDERFDPRNLHTAHTSLWMVALGHAGHHSGSASLRQSRARLAWRQHSATLARHAFLVWGVHKPPRTPRDISGEGTPYDKRPAER